MSDMLKRIDEYFANVSDEQLKKDMIESGYKLRCKIHHEFDPLNPFSTECAVCKNLVKKYQESKRYDSRYFIEGALS
jgi:hypothetical protein